MTADENPQVSDQSGSPELPTPTFSDKGASSTSSDADAIVSKVRTALVEEIKPLIEKMIEGKFKSTTDKRFAKLEKAMSKLDLLDELEAGGVQIPKELRTDMRIRDLEEQLSQSNRPDSPRDDGSSGKQAVEDALAELKKYDLTANDPAFIEILRGSYSSRDALDAKVQRYIIGKITPQKPVNTADVVQSAARGGTQDKSVETLTSEYITNMRAARGDKTKLMSLKEEYKKKGVDVYNVDFT